jgi:hypothetical protein
MTPIKIRNECGETIEIKFDAEGIVKIRHSDIDPKFWGELHEYSKRMRQPGIQAQFAERGCDPNSPLMKEAARRLGGYIVIRGKSYIISAEELAKIQAAVKQAGGIVPNWSSQP